jgi:hypothetical protein
MTSSDDTPKVVEGLKQFSQNLSQSITLFRWIGYVLLILALLDWIAVLIPPQLMNPVWEFQAMGNLVERVPVVLLAFVLVFYAKNVFRSGLEQGVVRVLSWLCLVLGIIFLLMIPLGVVNTVRLNNTGMQDLQSQYDSQVSRAEQLQTQLTEAPPEAIAQFLQSQGANVPTDDPEALKNELLSQLSEARQSFDSQFQETKATQRMNLFKNSIKWNLGALISGVLLIYIWRLTNWAR